MIQINVPNELQCNQALYISPNQQFTGLVYLMKVYDNNTEFIHGATTPPPKKFKKNKNKTFGMRTAIIYRYRNHKRVRVISLFWINGI